MDSASRIPMKNQTDTRGHDTGFPESFCGAGNTTLRHPDADTSPNASISASDIDVDKALVRTRRSFLTKHKHTVNYGKLTSADMADMAYGNVPPPAHSPTTTVSSMSGSFADDGRRSKDGDYDFRRSSSSAYGELYAVDEASHQQDGKLLVPARPSTSHQGGFLHRLRVHS